MNISLFSVGSVFVTHNEHKQAKAFRRRKTDTTYYIVLPRVLHSLIWLADHKKLLKQRADILVTHEAPSCHKYGFKTIDTLVHSLRVRNIFHGHHHQHYQSMITDGHQKITVNGVANKGIKTLSGVVL